MTTNVTLDSDGRPIAWGEANGGTVVHDGDHPGEYGVRRLPEPELENAPIRWNEEEERWEPIKE